MAQRLLDALVLVAALLDHGALVLAEPLPAGDGDDGAGRLGGGLPVGVLGARERREEQRDVPGCVRGGDDSMGEHQIIAKGYLQRRHCLNDLVSCD